MGEGGELEIEIVGYSAGFEAGWFGEGGPDVLEVFLQGIGEVGEGRCADVVAEHEEEECAFFCPAPTRRLEQNPLEAFPARRGGGVTLAVVGRVEDSLQRLFSKGPSLHLDKAPLAVPIN